jgi:deoxyribodipyrimidine photolyase-related protein
VIGMSQFADGGVVGTKPYIASGNYIDRMSNYCVGCRYRPGEAESRDACPFTALYWDFLSRHEDRLGNNRRMGFQLANLRKKGPEFRSRVSERAERVRLAALEGTL